MPIKSNPYWTTTGTTQERSKFKGTTFIQKDYIPIETTRLVEQKSFNVITYTGTAAVSQSQTGVGFQPDLVWTKARNTSGHHLLCDSLRGVTYGLYSNFPDPQLSNSTYVTSFDSDGFTHGNSVGIGWSATYVAWCWKANQTSSDASHNGEKYNTDTGLSVITYTGTGTVKTINHSLGVVPKLMIIKSLDVSHDWQVYHSDVGSTKYLTLNTSNA